MLLVARIVCVIAVYCFVCGSPSSDGSFASYVGMSAAIFTSPSQFSERSFVAALQSVDNTNPFVVMTFSPSTNTSLTLVDFVIMDDGQGSAVGTAAKLITAVPFADPVSGLAIVNVVVDSTIRYTPLNASVVSGQNQSSIFSSRDPGIAPPMIMWLATAAWALVVCLYMVFHWFRVVPARDLYCPSDVTSSQSMLNKARPSMILVPSVRSARCCPVVGQQEYGAAEHHSFVEEPLSEVLLPTCNAQDDDEEKKASHHPSSPLDGMLMACDEPLVLAAAGARHMVFVTTRYMYVWGDNAFGQLGLGYVSPWVSRSTSPSDPSDDTATTHPHHLSSLVSPADDDELEGWEITCGEGSFVLACITYHHFDSVDDVLGVACGTLHTLFWTVDGIYGCGSNTFGQLGLPNATMLSTKSGDPFYNDVVTVPTRVALFRYSDDIVSIAAGAYHSAVLTKHGLYTFGCNLDGQLLREGSGGGGGGPQRVLLEKVFQAPIATSPLLPEEVTCYGARTVVIVSGAQKAVAEYKSNENTEEPDVTPSECVRYAVFNSPQGRHHAAPVVEQRSLCPSSGVVHVFTANRAVAIRCNSETDDEDASFLLTSSRDNGDDCFARVAAPTTTGTSDEKRLLIGCFDVLERSEHVLIHFKSRRGSQDARHSDDTLVFVSGREQLDLRIPTNLCNVCHRNATLPETTTQDEELSTCLRGGLRSYTTPDGCVVLIACSIGKTKLQLQNGTGDIEYVEE